MREGLRLLVLDAYPREDRARLEEAGGTRAGPLYAALLRRLSPGVRIDLHCPADPGAGVPSGASLADYDGAVWTGSSLTIHEDDDPRVRRQVELARALLRAHVPSFGSCFAAQLAVVAAGGACRASPRGREFGVGRAITLTAEGERHPLYCGKPRVFDSLTSHADEVVTLPPGSTLLASNAFSSVQALEVEFEGGSFWAVQYHPEYDLHEIASLAALRADELVRQGTFSDLGAAREWIATLERLQRDGSDLRLAAAAGLGRDVLDADLRTLEVRNWLERGIPARRRGS
ncbi:MAG: type 1 glutamine amidotransferase [Myxococcota bacterium]